jgi:hypothetical protein
VFEDKRGYELHIPRRIADKLLEYVSNDDIIDGIKSILQTGIGYGAEAGGLDPVTAEVGSRTIGTLFKQNTEKFKQELASKMGRDGVVLTVKSSNPLHNMPDLGPLNGVLDPYGAQNRFVHDAITKLAPEETAQRYKAWQKRKRELTWFMETPIEAFIDSSTWSIQPRTR